MIRTAGWERESADRVPRIHSRKPSGPTTATHPARVGLFLTTNGDINETHLLRETTLIRTVKFSHSRTSRKSGGPNATSCVSTEAKTR